MNRNIDDLFLSNNLRDEESRDVTALVRQWADRVIISKRMEYRESYETLFLKKRLCLEVGLQKLIVPPEHGGFGWNNISHARGILDILIEIGRSDAGMAVAFAVTFWSLLAIAVEPYENKRLIEQFAPMFCKTNKAVFAANTMTEPQGGSDIENLGLWMWGLLWNSMKRPFMKITKRGRYV